MDANQEIDTMAMDITNVFVQNEVLKGHERTMLKIRGALSDMLLEIDPEKCKDFVIGEGCN